MSQPLDKPKTNPTAEDKRFVPVTRETYDALVAAFREQPGNVSAACRKVGCSRKTGSRAWRQGWPKRRWPAISQVLDEEQRLARAQRYEAELAARGLPPSPAAAGTEDGPPVCRGDGKGDVVNAGVAEEMQRMKARQDAVEARAQEGQMTKLSRGNTIALLASTSHLLKTAMDRARQLDEEIRTGKVKMTPQQVMRHVQGCAYLAKTAAEAGKMTMEMERLLMGAPTEIIGIQAQSMTLDEASQVIGMAQRAMERVRENVVAEAVVVEPGGAPAPMPVPGGTSQPPAAQPDGPPAEEPGAHVGAPAATRTPRPAVALFPAEGVPPKEQLH